jgi:hypothetical protein
MTPPGPSRATFGVGSLGPADRRNGDRITVVDMRVRKSASPGRADFGFTGTISLNDGGAAGAVGMEPRVAIVDGIFALGMPMTWVIGFPVGQFAPGVVATIPVSRHLEINTAARMNIVATAYGSVNYPIYNVGLGLSEDLSRWAIRPEIGFTRLEADGEWLVQLGVGIEPPVPNRN